MAGKAPGKGFLRDRWLRRFLPSDVFDGFRATQFVSPGLLLVFFLPLFTVSLWLFYAWSHALPVPVFLTKVSAFSALALLSVNHVLALRIRFLEKLFRGLDRMYRLHHITGQFALILAILHPLLLLLARKGNLDMLLDLTIPGRDFGITLGMFSLYLLLALLFATFSLKITYHKWHLSHHLMVIPLFIAFLHAVASGSYVKAYPFLRLWIIVLCALGMSAYIYTMLFYQRIGPLHRGRVVNVRDSGGIMEVSFSIDGDVLDFKAGQFVFIRFLSLNQSYEMFPFSLSSSPENGVLRISVKKSGDFTRHILPGLKEGDRIQVWGPYGTFGEHYHHRIHNSIWIAGGIGITPFLSMIHAEKEKSGMNRRRIIFIWVCNSNSDAVYNDEIHRTIEGMDRLHYTLWTSSTMGRIAAKDILKLSADSRVNNKFDVFICGPPPMMESLSHQFIDIGFSSKQIFFEDFSLL